LFDRGKKPADKSRRAFFLKTFKPSKPADFGTTVALFINKQRIGTKTVHNRQEGGLNEYLDEIYVGNYLGCLSGIHKRICFSQKIPQSQK
jgi:hypothetical protein